MNVQFKYSANPNYRGASVWGAQTDWLCATFGRIGEGWDYYSSMIWFKSEQVLLEL